MVLWPPGQRRELVALRDTEREPIDTRATLSACRGLPGLGERQGGCAPLRRRRSRQTLDNLATVPATARTAPPHLRKTHNYARHSTLAVHRLDHRRRSLAETTLLRYA